MTIRVYRYRSDNAGLVEAFNSDEAMLVNIMGPLVRHHSFRIVLGASYAGLEQESCGYERLLNLRDVSVYERLACRDDATEDVAVYGTHAEPMR
jgi:hypothetical protein